MPEISRFLGIIIAMYYRDHSPPHFHTVYGDYEVTVQMGTGEVQGFLPRHAMAAVQEWRRMHQAELASAWELARTGEKLPRIPPLE
jgi:hypothetical protein